jgi:hypothetical protein
MLSNLIDDAILELERNESADRRYLYAGSMTAKVKRRYENANHTHLDM